MSTTIISSGIQGLPFECSTLISPQPSASQDVKSSAGLESQPHFAAPENPPVLEVPFTGHSTICSPSVHVLCRAGGCQVTFHFVSKLCIFTLKCWPCFSKTVLYFWILTVCIKYWPAPIYSLTVISQEWTENCDFGLLNFALLLEVLNRGRCCIGLTSGGFGKVLSVFSIA